MTGFDLGAKDGVIGKVDDFLFDDNSWVIRYLVVDIGSWLTGRKVLISPAALANPSWKVKSIPVALTKQQVESSPDIDTTRPISRQCEIDLHEHYHWAPYWGAGGFAVGIAEPTEEQKKQAAEEAKDKVHPGLRSTTEVAGYRIHAMDGEIGHVEDLIVDDENWTIRFMVIDTRNWLPGRKVLISPLWIESVSWPESSVRVDLFRNSIKDSPPYDPSAPINRRYEEKLYDFYGRPRHWA